MDIALFSWLSTIMARLQDQVLTLIVRCSIAASASNDNPLKQGHFVAGVLRDKAGRKQMFRAANSSSAVFANWNLKI
jgi:hypothetical protein